MCSSTVISDGYIKTNLSPVHFRWTLDDFEEIRHRSECVSSPLFGGSIARANDDIQWKLILCPNGREKGAQHVTLSLQMVSANVEHKVYAGYSISLLDENNAVSSTVREKSLFSSDESFRYDICLGEDLVKSESALFNGQVTFCVQVFYITEYVSERRFKAMIKISSLYRPTIVPVSGELQALYEHNKWTDAKIIAKGTELMVHVVVLCAASPAFEEKFANSKDGTGNVIIDDDFDADIIKAMVDFIYLGNIVNGRQVYDLIRAADKYDLEGLKFVCQQMVFDQLTPGNAVEALIAADAGHAQNLTEAIIYFVAENAEQVTSSVSWMEKITRYPLIVSHLVRTMGSELVTLQLSFKLEVFHLNCSGLETLEHCNIETLRNNIVLEEDNCVLEPE